MVNLKILIIPLLLLLAVLACDSRSDNQRPPTAMQLIQGKWIFDSKETLQFNPDLEEVWAEDPALQAKMAQRDTSYILNLTPLALYVQDGGESREYLIKSVSDNGRELLLAIQPKEQPGKEHWSNYTFTLEDSLVIVDTPDQGRLVFRHMPQ